MKKPLVSIILDNYNYGEFIGEAIESVLRQTYQHYELIIVDDGSTDTSRKIIRRYGEKFPEFIVVLKKNGGQTSAFNAGVAIAKGEIVAFLDSDDYWYPNKLITIVAKHEKYQIVQHYLSHNGKGIYRKVHENVNWHEIMIKYGYLYNHSVCSSLSFSKQILDKIFPLIDEQEMRYCTDGVVLMACLSLCEVGIISEVLGFYRVHGSNLFVGNTDKGEKARKILAEQHVYVNKQLRKSRLKEIAFDPYDYFIYLIGECLAKGSLKLDSKCVLYGTETSGLHMSKVLEQERIFIYGYADSNVEKQQTLFQGKKVFSPKELKKYKNDFDKIIIASSAFASIGKTLESYGFEQEQDYLILPI